MLADHHIKNTNTSNNGVHVYSFHIKSNPSIQHSAPQKKKEGYLLGETTTIKYRSSSQIVWAF